MGSEDQALIVHSKKIRRDYHHSKGKKIRRDYHHSKGKNFNSRKSNKDISKYKCFTCDELRHFSRDCPKNKNSSHKKKGNKRRHHAHAVEDDEPSTKRNKQVNDDSSSEEEYLSRELSHMAAMIVL